MIDIARPRDSHPGNRQRKEDYPCGAPFQETANNNGVARTSIGQTSRETPLIYAVVAVVVDGILEVKSRHRLSIQGTRPVCFSNAEGQRAFSQDAVPR